MSNVELRTRNMRDLENQRLGVYRPVDPNLDLRPVQHIAYNLVTGPHLSIGSQTEGSKTVESYPTHFSHIKSRGKSVLLLAANAVSHLNHFKGDKISHPSNLEVRTFIEELRAGEESPYLHRGIRVHHFLVPSHGQLHDSDTRVVEKPLVIEHDVLRHRGVTTGIRDEDTVMLDAEQPGHDSETTRLAINMLLQGGAGIEKDLSLDPELMSSEPVVTMKKREVSSAKNKSHEDDQSESSSSSSSSSSRSSSSSSSSSSRSHASLHSPSVPNKPKGSDESSSSALSSGESGSDSSSDSDDDNNESNDEKIASNTKNKKKESGKKEEEDEEEDEGEEEDEDEDSDEKDDMEVDEEDEEAIAKRDAGFFRHADKEEYDDDDDDDDDEFTASGQKNRGKKNNKKTDVNVSAKNTDTFAVGFQASIHEAKRFIDFQSGKGKEFNSDQKEYLKRDAALEDREALAVHTVESDLRQILGVDNVYAAHDRIMLPYLSDDPAAVRGRSQDKATVPECEKPFFDKRECVDPNPAETFSKAINSTGQFQGVQTYSQFDGQLNPESILSPITAMTYFTQDLDRRQCDLSAYFNIEQEQADMIIRRASELDGGEPTAALQQPQRDENNDEPLMDDSDPLNLVAKEYLESRKQIHSLASALTEHPHRIELMKAAKITPSSFRGFPYPELVYELPAHLVRPEILLALPLPHTLCTHVPMALMENESSEDPPIIPVETLGLNHPHFREHVLALNTAPVLIEANSKGIRTDVHGAHSRGVMQRAMANEVQRQRHFFDMLSRNEVAFPRTLKTKVQLFEAARAIQSFKKPTPAGLSQYDIYMATTLDRLFHRLLSRAHGTLFFDRFYQSAYVEDTKAVFQADGAAIVEDGRVSARGEMDGEVDGDARALDPTISRIHKQMKESRSAAQVAKQRAQMAPHNNGGADDDEDSFSASAIQLSSLPAEIIEKDDALQLNIKFTRSYQRINKEFRESPNPNEEAYSKRMWSQLIQNLNEANTTFFQSTNIDSRSIKAREWFEGLKPQQRTIQVPCLPNMTPYASFRIWLNETLVSPVAGLSHNATSMTIGLLASRHASRYYEDSSDPHINVIYAGDGMAGKSFMLNQIGYLSVPGTCVTTDHTSTHALHVPKNMDGFCYIIHEFQHRYLFPAVAAKDGSGGTESGDALTFFKARLTKGRSSIIVLKHNKDTGERDIEMFETSNQGVTIGATNDKLTNADENVLSRFIVLSIPKPQAQAEGSSPVDRCNNDDIEFKKLLDIHYKERTVLAHQLLHFANMRSDFFCKAGVYAFQSFGGRFAVDVVLNTLQKMTGTETRDPRKRKLTEEMARTFASLYMNWMALASPMVHKYAAMPGSPDLWSPEAHALLALPFAFIPKEAVFDALTLLENIWTPNYFTRILYSMAFEVAYVQNLESKCFARSYRRIQADGTPLSTGNFDSYSSATNNSGMGGSNKAPLLGAMMHPLGSANTMISQATPTTEVVYDYNYVVIEGDTDQAIFNKITDRLASKGIRIADVDYYVSRCCKQFITTYPLVREGAPPPVAQNGATSVPVTARPVRQHMDPFESLFDASANKSPAVDSSRSLAHELREAQLAAMTETVRHNSTSTASSIEDTDELAMSIERNLVAQGLPPIDEVRRGGAAVSMDTTSAAPRYASDGLKLIYDKSKEPVRIPIMKRGLKDPTRPNGGRVLYIATEYLQQRLGFDISRPQTMRDRVALETVSMKDPMPSHTIEEPQLLRDLIREARTSLTVPPKSFEWGHSASLDFTRRMALARDLSDASKDSSCVMAMAIAKSFGNCYLELPPSNDKLETARYAKLCEAYDRDYAADPNPAKVKCYPWNNYITSYSCGEYFLRSVQPIEHPNGRHLSFFDVLKTLPLARNENNKKPLSRDNFSRLGKTGSLMLDFVPFGRSDALAVYDNDEDDDDIDNEECDSRDEPRTAVVIVSGSERTRVLRESPGLYYTADINYYESYERMSSICHIGLPYAPNTRVPGWSPVTYQIMRYMVSDMVSKGELDMRPRSDIMAQKSDKGLTIVKYPENDPRLLLEYPAIEIVARIREAEIRDANEARGNYSHQTSADEVYNQGRQKGQLAFLSSADVLSERNQNDVIYGGRISSDISTTTTPASSIGGAPLENLLNSLCDESVMANRFGSIARNFQASRHQLATRAPKQKRSSIPSDALERAQKRQRLGTISSDQSRDRQLQQSRERSFEAAPVDANTIAAIDALWDA